MKKKENKSDKVYPANKRHGLDAGIGIDNCDFPIPEGKSTRSEFPLSLFLQNYKGEFFISEELRDDCTVEGIVLRDTIILRQTIAPYKLKKRNPTRVDLYLLAKEVHPLAKPLYFHNFPSGGGIVTLLLIDGKRYTQTAELLKKHGVIMPNISQELHFVGGSYCKDDSVNTIMPGAFSGISKIKIVKEMLLAIPIEAIEAM